MKIILATALAFAAASPAAASFITNGGFETGDYTGWTASVEGGSNGGIQVINYGSSLPFSGLSYQNNANGGTFFSVTDQGGPGSYSLTQSFTLTATTRVIIKFDMFANNAAGVDIANGRSAFAGANQNAVVDLLIASASAFTNAPGDIVAVLYGPGSDTAGNPNPWTSYSSALTLGAGTYQLRFAETDNQLFFNQGVDNVSVAAVPESATWAMLITGFGLVGAAARRRRAVAA
jgi:hypothetical protein